MMSVSLPLCSSGVSLSKVCLEDIAELRDSALARSFSSERKLQCLNESILSFELRTCDEPVMLCVSLFHLNC